MGTVAPTRRVVIDLCGGTGSWSRPYIEAGYDVRIVDRLTTGEDVRLLSLPRRRPHGVLAAPPCQHFSASGARWWAKRGDAALLEGPSIVDACLRFIVAAQPEWWVLENPEGRLRRFLGPPVFTFHPYQFGGLFSKKTLLWGRFTPPTIGPVVEPSKGKWGHRDAPRSDRGLKRAMTFSGFAQAFFEANP